jgi:flagellar basal body-associated protein FliL
MHLARKKKMRITLLDVVLAVLLLAAGAYFAYRVRVGLHYRWNWAAT